ncbi:MAG: malonyl-CoA decarboxylase [Bacteroidetes bacterium]|nr:malonyl-CoA decarboxylase [Bacteroidota bacterium]
MNIIGRFTKNLVDSVADAGEKFLNIRKLRGTSTQILLDLCDDLISHKGVASGIALAREVMNRYNQLSRKEKLTFFNELNKKMGPNLEKIVTVAQAFIKQPDEKTLLDLSHQMKSKRQKLFSRMIMAPNGTKSIVSLREDLLGFIKSGVGLEAIDEELRGLLTSWFNPGFLVLRKIDWDTEASILEKIIQYEAVHSIADWNDLKSRLTTNRRCFAYFHPALDDEPLIFVEVALTKGITGSIQSIFNEQSVGKKEADTAIFYSINNCQRGLKKIPLGNFLIKMVVTELALELPTIKKYSTLSPIPGFADWLKDEIKSGSPEFIAEEGRQLLKSLEDEAWYKDPKKSEILKKPLVNACAIYLIRVKKYNKPVNSVARFHFGNGAKLYRINWMGNTSEYGIAKSFGLMVNYLYDLKKIEANHEAYVQNGELAISKTVKSILAMK